MLIKESLYKVPFSHLRVLDHKAIVHVDSSYHRWDSHHAHSISEI